MTTERDDPQGAVRLGPGQLGGWWRAAQDGSISHALGDDAQGLLVYAPRGHMTVHLVGARARFCARRRCRRRLGIVVNELA